MTNKERGEVRLQEEESKIKTRKEDVGECSCIPLCSAGRCLVALWTVS